MSVAHKRDLVSANKEAGKGASALEHLERERLKSREGRAKAAQMDAAIWETALREEQSRGAALEEAAYGEVVSLQEEVATLRARCAAAESGLGQVGSQLAKKSAALEQKDGQIKRLVTACSVLEQKVRTLGSGGHVDDEEGAEPAKSSGNSGDASGLQGSIMTVENFSKYTASGQRCATCGQIAEFNRSREAAPSGGFVPSDPGVALREMTRFGTTAKWAPQPAPPKPGHYEDGTTPLSNSEATQQAIADASGALLLENGPGDGNAGTMGTAARLDDGPAEPPPPEPEPEWLRGDDGWYFGDVDNEGETMCWMASRRVASPERSASALGESGRLQLTNGAPKPPPRSQSAGLPPLNRDERKDKDGAPAGVSWSASVGEAGAERRPEGRSSKPAEASVVQLDVTVPASSAGKGAKLGASGSIFRNSEAQGARLPRLAGHLHVPPCALQQAQQHARVAIRPG